MHEITVRGVQLDHLETSAQRTFGRGGERRGQLLDLHHGQRARRWITRAVGFAAGSDGLPTAALQRHGPAAFPRSQRAGLATGVRQLNRGDRTLLANERSYWLQDIGVRLRPDPEILRRNAALGR